MEEALRELFRQRFGVTPESLLPLKSDGSGRRYWRLTGGGKTVVGAHGPDKAENRAFLTFSRHFRTAALPVPEIYGEDLERGVYLMEDLGDVTLFGFLSKRRASGRFPQTAIPLYEKAVRLLPRFQIEAGQTLDYSVCYPRASFDQRSILWDLNYFKYYFLRLAAVPFNEQELEDDFQRFTAFLLEAGQDHFMYRDFQSRNIMIRGGEPWFIDYQGGRRGPLQYDIASLLYDAKADIPPDVRDRLLETYLAAAESVAPFSRERFMRYYPAYVLIRIMQALGAYGLRGFYERKTHFLQSIPYAVRNIEYLLGGAKLPVEVPALMAVLHGLVGITRLRHFEPAKTELTVQVQSFSYKRGVPIDDTEHGGGFVFDCRALPNPGRSERFATMTGRDRPVAEFLEAEAPVQEFLRHVMALVDQSVVSYRSRNFNHLSVSFGCTGGQHRSVFCAERLAAHLRLHHPVEVRLNHLSLEPATAPTS